MQDPEYRLLLEVTGLITKGDIVNNYTSTCPKELTKD